VEISFFNLNIELLAQCDINGVLIPIVSGGKKSLD